MKKKLLTLWVAWLLAWSPNVHAGSDSLKTETNKNLIGAVTTNKQDKSKEPTTISLEDGKKLVEQKEILEKVLNDEKVQAVIETYWQENIEKIIKEVINSSDTEKIVKKAMEDKEIQKALKEWNKEKFEELIRKIVKDYHKDPLWVLIVDAVITIVAREFWKFLSRKLYE